MLKKIVIIGPESTGKSTLCEQIALQYGTLWCPEFAREYLLKYGMDYVYNDLLTIAKGQVAMEEEYVAKVVSRQLPVGNRQSAVGSQQLPVGSSQAPVGSQQSGNRHSPLLFIDTDMYVMKVWSEFVFGKCHQWIIDQIVERKYDLYLLCNIDHPWTKDELREYPDIETRRKLYHMYKDFMINQPVPWVDIRGDYKERLERAITGTDKILKVQQI